MKILISAASRHGATTSIGKELASVFVGAGADVDMPEPESVRDTREYDALIIGSGVYSSRWIPAANDLVRRLTDAVHPPVWLFSCGPTHSIDRAVNDTADASRAIDAMKAVGHRTFPGRLDPSRLSRGERAVFDASGAAEGDFRDWALVRAWALHILDAIHRAP